MQIYLLNGFLFLIPVLFWNILLAKKLPEGFSSENFDKNVPPSLLMLENALRLVVMILPLFMPAGLDTPVRKAGWIIYTIGILLYFSSWLLQIFFPQSKWSRSKAGFLAPAYTPTVWLSGIGLATGSFLNFRSGWISLAYIVLSFIFLTIHCLHASTAYRNLSGRDILT